MFLRQITCHNKGGCSDHVEAESYAKISRRNNAPPLSHALDTQHASTIIRAFLMIRIVWMVPIKSHELLFPLFDEMLPWSRQEGGFPSSDSSLSIIKPSGILAVGADIHTNASWVAISRIWFFFILLSLCVTPI